MDTGDFWDIGTMQTSYTHHGMSVLGETPGSDPSSGTYRCYLHDHPEQMGSICGGRQALRSNAERLGSTRALYDDDKVILASTEYLPYGAFLSNAGASENPGGMPTFTGKPYDAEIGLYYFPYRYYSAAAARWLNRDPLGMIDGPNLYAYVKERTVAARDPDGLAPWWRRGKICTDESCAGKDLGPVKVLPEDDWTLDNPNWQAMPPPGMCKLADGIAIPSAPNKMGRKIPGRATCTLVCDSCGTKELRCKRRRFWDIVDPGGPIRDWPDEFPKL